MKKVMSARKNILPVVLLIVFSVATVTGGTLAWFTDKTEPIANTFVAGTVKISAKETVHPPAEIFENWNPGDETYKEYTITNDGTKSVYIRGILTGGWYERDGTTALALDPDPKNVSWHIVPERSDEGWVRIGDTLYFSRSIPGSYTQGSEDGRKAKVTIKVVLDGASTDNRFQGKVYKLNAAFEAVQSSHRDIGDIWTDYADGGSQNPDNPGGGETEVPGETEPVEPDQPGDGEDLPPEGVERWIATKGYGGASIVWHNGRLYKAWYYANPGDEPGVEYRPWVQSVWQDITNEYEWVYTNRYQKQDAGNNNYIVYYNGARYEAKWETKGAKPGEQFYPWQESPWQEITKEWRYANSYKKNDIVWHNGVEYKAKWDPQGQEPGKSGAWEKLKKRSS